MTEEPSFVSVVDDPALTVYTKRKHSKAGILSLALILFAAHHIWNSD